MHELGIIDGRFVVERACGSGGMGSVYRALDQVSGLPVAVKVLHESNPRLRERFDREARTLATFEHPNIVRYVAHGTTSADLHYLVMEWIDGETLKVRLEREGLDADAAVGMVVAVADALAAAHARGVVHRDVKPSNILFVEGDPARVKLIDFGIARAASETVKLTEVGASVGTPGYMAPEQVRSSREVDGRADLFALGCVLYECLSGRRAFAGADAVEVWIKIVLAQPTSLRLLAPGLPEALLALVAQLLAKEPDERPRGAAEVVAALKTIGSIGAAARRLMSGDELPTMAAAARADAALAGKAVSGDDRTRAEPTRTVFLIVATDSRADAPSGDSGSAVSGSAHTGSAHTGTAGTRRRAEIGSAVEALAREHGGHADFLAEGSVVLTLEATATAEAATARAAAACALALRRLFAGAMIAITTGSGPQSSPVLDDVIARGLRLIEGAALEAVTGDTSAADGVQLDEATARLLGDSFTVKPTLSGYQLRP